MILCSLIYESLRTSGTSIFSGRVHWQHGQLARSCSRSERLPCVLLSLSTNIAFDSHLRCLGQTLSCCSRSLHVRSSFISRKASWYQLNSKTLSWETMLTTNFELDVLRRKRPYKWTIWVGSLHHIEPHHHPNRSSYTLEPATQDYSPSSAYSSISTSTAFPVR